MSTGGGMPATSYQQIIPDAMVWSPLPSLAERTLIRTCPNSLPILVAHAAVPAAAPASFLEIWKVNKRKKSKKMKKCRRKGAVRDLNDKGNTILYLLRGVNLEDSAKC